MMRTGSLFPLLLDPPATVCRWEADRLSPDASMIIMTPVAPHTMNTRSIVFPAEDVLTVEIGQRRPGVSEKGLASFDGGYGDSHAGGRLHRDQQGGSQTKIIKLNHLSFVEVLRQKMRNS